MSEHIEKYDDEIDPLTVFEGFWKKRLLVLVVVLIGFPNNKFLQCEARLGVF